MVFATMGNSYLEAAAIDWKLIYFVVSFFSFRKCKCVPGPPSGPVRPPISKRLLGKCVEDATCDVLGIKNECPYGVCYNG